MKLSSFVTQGRPSYGLIDGDRVHDLGRRLGPAYPTLRTAIAAGVLDSVAKDVATARPDFTLSQLTLLPPIPDPEKIVCVGLNYRAHAAEGGMKIPEYPMLFARFANTLVAHEAEMIRPKLSGDFDYEGELAIVIGRGGRHIAKQNALQHVFGYACFNDGSVRDFQFKQSLIAGKNFPRTGGFGPWIVTADEIPDPSKLVLTTRLNGTQVQHKGLDDMIFDVPTIISYVSSWTELVPGDVVSTGTPEGVGFARKPPLWLKPGDIVEVEISRIGVLRNRIEMEAA
jgi:2-keto-4-pentenoate hydratase/2-oxohepta-3-ene-1,7-dioic acid hydratase in catechol pathway